MKDHEIRELVNQLRDVAIKYHGAGQLREQIARTVRAAILQAQSEDGEPTDDERIMAIEGILNCDRCGDEGWIVGEMGITRCACCQAGTLINEGTIQAGNSPVIPEGYVMVPVDLLSELRDWAHPEIEKYCEMWEGRRDREFPALRKVITDADALLVASPQPQNSPQNIPEIIPGWIPVSERLPEKGQAVLVYRPKAHEGGDSDVRVAVYGRHNFEHGFGCYWEPSHWMPLPAAPQEVKP
ncbi:TPA: DUF551 domain-containing protein [Klebsiella pneumoniae]|nr:DUF551 domain-containing protein [Klebsiella pneumoniae]